MPTLSTVHTCEDTEVSHLTKLERIERKRRKRQSSEDYKGNRSPQPYERNDEEEILDQLEEWVDEANQL